MKAGKSVGQPTPPGYRWRAVVLLALLVPGTAMATIALHARGTPAEVSNDKTEVAIDTKTRVTTIAAGQLPHHAMPRSAENGLERFLDVYTKIGQSHASPVPQPADLPGAFGVAPPDQAELQGTLTLPATLVERQTPMSAFSAETATLAEAVAASCIDPAGVAACIGTTTMALRPPELTERADGHPTPALIAATGVAVALAVLYPARRARQPTAKAQRHIRQQRTGGKRGKTRVNTAPIRQVRRPLAGAIRRSAVT
ncbi:MAG: hypothetical protein KDI88_07805 [Gammaproteobacteria bacterium]|nr:hypothetical protein [Gammaproteobacteria bacterium]